MSPRCKPAKDPIQPSKGKNTSVKDTPVYPRLRPASTVLQRYWDNLQCDTLRLMFGLKGEGHRKAAGVSPVSVLEFAGFVTLLLTFVYYFAFLANKLKLFLFPHFVCSCILSPGSWQTLLEKEKKETPSSSFEHVKIKKYLKYLLFTLSRKNMKCFLVNFILYTFESLSFCLCLDDVLNSVLTRSQAEWGIY